MVDAGTEISLWCIADGLKRVFVVFGFGSGMSDIDDTDRIAVDHCSPVRVIFWK